MANIRKSTTAIALDSKAQNSFVKGVAKIKKTVKKNFVQAPERKTTNESTRGLIYISHIPHGFYEDELNKYFKQFGHVTNVRLLRSNKTGRSKGAAYVEFKDEDVAKIAAETMDNYLMFKRRIEAKYVPPEERHKSLFKIHVSALKYPGKKAVSTAREAKNKNISRELHEKKITAMLKKLHTAGTLDGVQVTHLNFSVDGIKVNGLEKRKEDPGKMKKGIKKLSVKTPSPVVVKSERLKKVVVKKMKKRITLKS